MPLSASHYTDGPEALLVDLATRGDSRAFEELARRRQAWIRQLLWRCCLNENLAEDLAQEAFLTAWRKLRQLREPDKFASWLKQIAISTWLQHQRKNELPTTDEEVADLRSVPDRPGLARDLDRALAALPTEQRLCIVLSYQEGHSHGEISELTKMPLGTVKSHITRGSAALREQLAIYGKST